MPKGGSRKLKGENRKRAPVSASRLFPITYYLLITTFSFQRARPRWWQWLTVLSLDAPVVALLWQWQLARVAGVVPGAPRVFVLGVSVWLAYAADRWIEGWRLAPGRIRTQRHSFYQRNRWPIAAFWAALFAADLAAALTALDRRALIAGFLLLIPVSAYLLSHQFVHRHRRWRLPKEACVALLLGGGVALFVVTAPAAALRPLAGPFVLFVLLCFANCALISVWEKSVDESHGQTSLARQFRGAVIFGRAFPWLLAAAALLAGGAATGAARTAVLCAAASGLLLALIDRLQPRIGWPMARVLADVALMTPVVPLAACWFDH